MSKYFCEEKMGNQYSMRLITESDAEDVLKIYSYYVLESVISFEYVAPSQEDFLQRITTISAQYPWLVFLSGNRIIGYAYASSHRQRTAYQWSCESSVYLLPQFHGKGIARILYRTLFSLLRLQGYFNVYAGVSLPNKKSVDFHRSFGFGEVGVFKEIGYKFGEWHDVQWFQFELQQHIYHPPSPRSMQSIINSNEFKNVFVTANGFLEKINTEKI